MSAASERRQAYTLRKQARRWEREREFADKAIALGMYGVVLEDFEWDYETWSAKGRSRHSGRHYVTARDAHKAEEIVARTEERFLLAAPDCCLFKWTTVPHQAIAFDVLRLRGFEYRSSIVWDKMVPAHGHWSMNQHEVILIGVRGEVPCPAQGQQWPRSIIYEKKRS